MYVHDKALFDSDTESDPSAGIVMQSTGVKS